MNIYLFRLRFYEKKCDIPFTLKNSDFIMKFLYWENKVLHLGLLKYT